MVVLWDILNQFNIIIFKAKKLHNWFSHNQMNNTKGSY